MHVQFTGYLQNNPSKIRIFTSSNMGDKCEMLLVLALCYLLIFFFEINS